jgi:hypothetical protein
VRPAEDAHGETREKPRCGDAAAGMRAGKCRKSARNGHGPRGSATAAHLAD